MKEQRWFQRPGVGKKSTYDAGGITDLANFDGGVLAAHADLAVGLHHLALEDGELVGHVCALLLMIQHALGHLLDDLLAAKHLLLRALQL